MRHELFYDGVVKGTALCEMWKVLGITPTSEGAVAMILTNKAQLAPVKVPAGCPVADEGFLADSFWKLIFYFKTPSKTVFATCPFSPIDDAVADLKENYTSREFMLSASQLAAIDKRFVNGDTVWKTTNGDKFQISQTPDNLYNTRRGAGGGRQSMATIVMSIDCVEDPSSEEMNKLQRLWTHINHSFQWPYRFLSSGGLKGKNVGSDGQLMRYTYVEFRDGDNVLGHGVLEGDTDASGSSARCEQFNPITNDMLSSDISDVADGSEQHSKRRKRRNQVDNDMDKDDRNVDDDDDDNNNEEDEFDKVQGQLMEQIETAAALEPRPVVGALPEWFPLIAGLRQGPRKSAVSLPCGNDSFIQAKCVAKMCLPSTVVRSIGDSNGSSERTAYFCPYNENCLLVVMSHSSANIGVQSVSLVSASIVLDDD